MTRIGIAGAALKSLLFAALLLVGIFFVFQGGDQLGTWLYAQLCASSGCRGDSPGRWAAARWWTLYWFLVYVVAFYPLLVLFLSVGIRHFATAGYRLQVLGVLCVVHGGLTIIDVTLDIIRGMFRIEDPEHVVNAVLGAAILSAGLYWCLRRPPPRPVAMPEQAFLRDYQVDGTYADCYALDLSRTVSQAQFIEAFYTTPLFKLERMILKWLVERSSTDADARELAAGHSQRFAAWSVEHQDAEQLLLCDFQGRTRSWLMAVAGEAPGTTRLHFGSAVVPVRDASGGLALGWPFKALLGFHKLYSRLLLSAAARRLSR